MDTCDMNIYRMIIMKLCIACTRKLKTSHCIRNLRKNDLKNPFTLGFLGFFTEIDGPY